MVAAADSDGTFIRKIPNPIPEIKINPSKAIKTAFRLFTLAFSVLAFG